MAKIVILVILVYVSGIILSFLQGSHWAFYLYQIVYFLNPVNRWWSSSIPSFGYSMVTVIVLFLTYFINRKKFNKNKFLHSSLFKLFFLLIGLYCLTYFIAIDQQLHKQAMIDFLKMFLILSIAFKIIDSMKKLEFSLLVYITGSAYIGYEAFVVGRNSQGRVEGIGLIDAPEANGTAAAIVASLPFIIYFLWWGNKKIKIAMMIMGPVIVNGLILINSRGAFLGAVVGATVFMWSMLFSHIKTKNQRIVAIGLIVLGLSGVFTLIDESFFKRMITLTNVEDESASGSHRYHMWFSAINLAKDYPYGVGAYGFEILSQAYVPEELFFGGQEHKAVHSIWFQALSEIGWIGFFIFLIIIISAFISLYRVKRKCMDNKDMPTYYFTQALFSAFIGLLITSSFINQLRVQMIYWFILFVACLYSIVLKNEIDR